MIPQVISKWMETFKLWESQWANIFSKLTNTDSRMSVGMFLTLNFSPNMHVRINGTKYSTVNQVKLVEDSL